MGKYDHINFKPPKRAQRAYANGLKRHADGETGDGLEAATVRMAQRFADGEAASPEWTRKGNRWWGRNERFADAEPGTPAYAAAQLWGGYNWFAPIVRQMDKADEENKMKLLDTARTPNYDGTESTEWNKPSFEQCLAGYYRHTDAEKPDENYTSVDDLPAEVKRWIAGLSLLGDPGAETFNDLVFFPVVNPSTNRLNENALRAVLGGRGSQADIPQNAKESAQNRARSLLEDEFEMAEKAVNLSQQLEDIRQAFLSQYNSPNNYDYWVRDVYDEYVVVSHESESGVTFYQVGYSEMEDGYEFAPRAEWMEGEYVFTPSGEKRFKAGRVLSQRNADDIVSAVVSLAQVLERAGIDVPGFDSDEAEDEPEEESSNDDDEAPVVGTPPQVATLRSTWESIMPVVLNGDMPQVTAGDIESIKNVLVAPGIGFATSPSPLIAFGGTVKALGDGKVGGYLVVFSDKTSPDLENEFFTRDTDYALTDPAGSLVFFHHGLDPNIGKKRLTASPAMLKVDDFGVWVEAQLALRDEYEKWIYERTQQAKMGWSSGTAPNLVEIISMDNGTGWIKTWPLGLDASITPTPAEPRAKVLPLKTYAKMLGEPQTVEGPHGEDVARQIELERERTRLLKIL
jgi:hypothetical protein